MEDDGSENPWADSRRPGPTRTEPFPNTFVPLRPPLGRPSVPDVPGTSAAARSNPGSRRSSNALIRRPEDEGTTAGRDRRRSVAAGISCLSCRPSFPSDPSASLSPSSVLGGSSSRPRQSRRPPRLPFSIRRSHRSTSRSVRRAPVSGAVAPRYAVQTMIVSSLTDHPLVEFPRFVLDVLLLAAGGRVVEVDSDPLVTVVVSLSNDRPAENVTVPSATSASPWSPARLSLPCCRPDGWLVRIEPFFI